MEFPDAPAACRLFTKGMNLRECMQMDAMHTYAGNVKGVIFMMLRLLPLPGAPVLIYDQQHNGMDPTLMVLSE